MKTKHAAFLTVVVLGFAATLFAVEKQSLSAVPKHILLKSNGATIAELKLSQPTVFVITGQQSSTMEHDAKSGRVSYKGGVTIQLQHDGNSSVSIKADEIEVIPDVK